MGNLLPPHSGYAFPGLENLHNDIYPAIDASKNVELKQPGKVVLITGAGRGIGRAIALQYAFASVALIVLCARTCSELDEVEGAIKKIDGRVRVLKQQLDVSDASAVKAFAEDFQVKEGRLDVLVNNAGICSWKGIADTNHLDWWRVMEINLKGPFLLLQAFLPLLVATSEKQNTYVNVVNVTSVGGVVCVPEGSAYGISKLALQRLTEFVDIEYADKGVNVVGLHPGGVSTKLAKEIEVIQDCKLTVECNRNYVNPDADLVDTPELCGGFVAWLTAQPRTYFNGR